MPRRPGFLLAALFVTGGAGGPFGGCSRTPAPLPIASARPPAVSEHAPAASVFTAAVPVATAAVPVASTAAVPMFPAAAPLAPVVVLPLPARCTESPVAQVFVSPRAPQTGRPLRILVHADQPFAGALVLRDPAGAVVQSTAERHGGPPYWWTVEVPAASAGTYHAAVQRGGAPGVPDVIASCLAIKVEDAPPPGDPRAWGMVWGNTRAWDKHAEDLYSAWIEKLFDAPLGEQLSWPALHEVLRDPKRNLLHDHHGEGEDDGGKGSQPIDPDCADLPYFLRAYFAFKLGLPFGYSSCTRGGGGVPPTCLSFQSNLRAAPQRRSAFATFTDFLRGKLADTVHSGTGRASAKSNDGDYYTVPLSLESLRPGTIYADPYGHILMTVKRIPQTEATGGILLAVDGQPDGTIARRRFWRGSFLFATEPEMGSPGFKHFRPVVSDPKKGVRALTNQEISAAPAYGDWSLAQYEGGVEGFYDRMDEVLSPSPLDPSRAMLETIAALEEQVKGRVLSVQNAETFFAGPVKRIDMPKGPAIFETTGPWEDFSTPSRDLRLLIAIDVVSGFPARVSRRPERFAMPAGKDVPTLRTEMDALLAKELTSRTFQYPRSDGSRFTLSLADIVSRAEALEMAYNPNDCPEKRWGAPPGSEEIGTCKRQASPSQALRMGILRKWFHERKRPARK